jgi:CheY-like chemotaxis protein
VDPIVAESAAPPVAEPPQAAASAEPAAAPAAAESAPSETLFAGRDVEIDRERSVLIADPSEDGGKATASAIASWGLQPLLVHDGVEAMMTIQRALPRVVVLDAALPKMFGFQICEIMKRNESLSAIKVVLVGAIHAQDRYRRPPSETYGADVYLEQPDLPDGLKPLLEQFGLPMQGGAAAPPAAAAEPAATREPAAAPMPTPEPPAAPAGDPALAEEREKAERLARIIVSDIVLYQGEKFDQALAAGNVLEMLDGEVEEGRKLFRQRIDERVREERDHLLDELMRVARERGMQ